VGESSRTRDKRLDAIVVGTGFGGAATACRLTQAGLSVLVLERGRRFGADDFPNLPTPDSLLPDFERWSWQSHRGLWDIRDLGPMVSVQAAGYGGGSLIYANVQLRPPPEVFSTWPAGYDAEQLRPSYDLAGWMLDIAPVDRSASFADLPKTRGFERALHTLGRAPATFRPPLAVSYTEHENAFGRSMKACTGCGKCCLGCPHEAKNSLDHNYLAILEQYDNAQVKTRCEVTCVHQLEAGYSVEYCDELDAGRSCEVSANYVFLAAGAIGTTRLLLRSRRRAEREPGRGLSRISERLGHGYYTNADSLSLVFDTPEIHEPIRGPTITSSTIHREREGFVLVQDGGYPSELSRLFNAFGASAWLGSNRFRSPQSGPGKVPQATAPPASEARASGEPAFTSPIDALTEAVRTGALERAIPMQLREATAALHTELLRETRPEFEALVDGLLDFSVATFLERVSGGRLPQNGRAYRFLARNARKLTLNWLTDRERLVGYAQAALLERFGLADVGTALPQMLSRFFGGHLEHAASGTVLLAMGRDAVPGALEYDEPFDTLRTQPQSTPDFGVLSQGERLKRDLATAMGGELRTNPLATLTGKPVTVHSQGGCGMAESAAEGVTSPEGEVHGHPGLFVADASLFPGSVGVNPSATVLAIAERNALRFVRRSVQNPHWPQGDSSRGALQLRGQVERAAAWARDQAVAYQLAPPEFENPPLVSRTLGLRFRETFTGFLAKTTETPQNEQEFQALEAGGREQRAYRIQLQVEIEDMDRFWRDPERRAAFSGTVEVGAPGSTQQEAIPTRGELRLLVDSKRVPELATETEERLFIYDLELTPSGSCEPLALRMYKRVPGVLDRFAWRSTSRCFSRLYRTASGDTLAAGMLRVDLSRFMLDTLSSLEVTGTADPARVLWTLAGFAQFFLGSLSSRAIGQMRRFVADSQRTRLVH
jgi:choline dehydrogenase-like flavoprotein